MRKILENVWFEIEIFAEVTWPVFVWIAIIAGPFVLAAYTH